MLTTEMSPIIAAAQAGDTIVVRHAGGRPTTYKIRTIGGKKARELKLEGRRGAMRVLVDGGDQIWIREASTRAGGGSAHRRVVELHTIGLDIRDPKTWTGEESERDTAIRGETRDELPRQGDTTKVLFTFKIPVDSGDDLSEPERDVLISFLLLYAPLSLACLDAVSDEELKRMAVDIMPRVASGDLLSKQGERDMAIRDAGLPPGYDVELHPRGFQAAQLGEPVGPVGASVYVAVCNAWAHWANGADARAAEAVLLLGALPPGYDIRSIYDPTPLTGPKRFLAVLDEPDRPTISPREREHAVEAVVDAWAHHAAKRELVAAERWKCIVERAQADERLLLDLPRGYAIEPGEPGFYRAVDDTGWVGATRSTTAEAVVDALVHATEQLETALGRHRTTAIDRDVARADASRCRRALRQIREIAKGTEPTGKELASGEMPEQVVAEVGHALRVESKRSRWVEVKLEQIDADPDRVLSGFIPKNNGTPSMKRDETP